MNNRTKNRRKRQCRRERKAKLAAAVALKVVCNYCGCDAKLVDSSVIYGRSYGMAWVCSNYPQCNAYVGVHKATNEPLGRLANAELREWKKRAHAVFDALWRDGRMSRGEAYERMQAVMEMTGDEAHIGKFDVDQCRRLVELFQRKGVLHECAATAGE